MPTSVISPATLLLPSRWWMPPNAAAHGFAVDHLMRWDLAWLVGMGLLAHLLLLIAFIRRRHARGAPSAWLVELLPLLAISLLFAWMTISAQGLWAGSRFEGPSPTAMQVEVVGQQFQWYFHYPGVDATYGESKPELVGAAAGNNIGLDPADDHGRDDLVASELVLPLGREIDVQLRSLDVIHGFFIPAMRLKQNAVPGLVLHVHFTPVATGVFPILCTQVCGSGHARMQARLRVVPPAEYQSWLAIRSAARARSTGGLP